MPHDALKSSVPGLIAQNCPDDDQENPRPKCKLTKRRHRHATVFVDHCSRLSCVHVHETTDADDAIAAKKAFEQHARERGVTIKHYHADNGIFKSAAFLQEVTKCQQTISFCGVDAHHQNGVADIYD